jgi:8-oxo-dGTP diphosphatase
MNNKIFWHRVASTLKKFPWLVVAARHVWRIRQTKFTAGAVGVVLNQERKVLLVEHVFHPKTPWGLPGGWMSYDEDPSEAIRREMHEELELDIDPVKVLIIKNDQGDHLDFAYLCHPLGQIGQLSDELLSYGWFDVDELPRVIKFHYQAIMLALEMPVAGEIENE